MSEYINEADPQLSPEFLNGKVEVLFHFGPHDTIEDAQEFAPFLEEADVYVPEVSVCPEQCKSWLARLGKGDYKSYERLKPFFEGEFARELFKVVYMRKSRQRLDVKVLDVPRTEQWKERMIRVREFATHMACLPTVDLSLERLSLTQQVVASSQGMRDEIIAENIFGYLTTRVESNNVPKDRPLKMLVTLGYTHTGVMEKLAEKGVPVTFTQNSTVNEDNGYYIDTVMKTFQRGEEPTRELMVKAFVGGLIAEQVTAKHTRARIKAIRIIVDSFTDSELNTICEQVASVYTNAEAVRAITQNAIQDKVGHKKLSDVEVHQLV